VCSVRFSALGRAEALTTSPESEPRIESILSSCEAAYRRMRLACVRLGRRPPGLDTQAACFDTACGLPFEELRTRLSMLVVRVPHALLLPCAALAKAA